MVCVYVFLPFQHRDWLQQCPLANTNLAMYSTHSPFPSKPFQCWFKSTCKPVETSVASTTLHLSLNGNWKWCYNGATLLFQDQSKFFGGGKWKKHSKLAQNQHYNYVSGKTSIREQIFNTSAGLPFPRERSHTPCVLTLLLPGAIVT